MDNKKEEVRLKMRKYNAGDKVYVLHVGECEVVRAITIDGKTWYILRKGYATFSVSENEIKKGK